MKDRLDLATEYLRGLAATLADHMLEDAADLLDEQAAQLFVLNESLAAYEAPAVVPQPEMVRERTSMYGDTFTSVKRTAVHGGAPRPIPLPPSS